jgi:hypothetical protein
MVPAVRSSTGAVIYQPVGLGMIDLQLGGPRIHAKAAPEKETPRAAEDRVAAAGARPGEIGGSKQSHVRRRATPVPARH